MNWMKYSLIYFAISALFIGAGVFGLVKWGLNLGVDFRGGAILEYKLAKDVPIEELEKAIKNNNVSLYSVQKSNERVYLIKIPPVSSDEKDRVFAALENTSGEKPEELKFENVGPSIGPDLVKKTFYAMGIAAVLILLWIAVQFRSFKFGISAVLAMFHDSLVLIGLFSLFGHYLGAEVDFLFVTAALIILSFSVHDTIVVYDRIRESQKKLGGNLYDLANKAVTETMVRSLNNSFTIIFMLVALILLGGSTIKWFAVALLIGTISGTYSSPFVAVPLLVSLDAVVRKIRKKNL